MVLGSGKQDTYITWSKGVLYNKLFYFIKAGQPRIWFSSTGQLLHWESPGTSRARELADVYRLLDCEEDLEGNDRMPALEALKNMVIDFVNLWAVHHMLSRKTNSKFFPIAMWLSRKETNRADNWLSKCFGVWSNLWKLEEDFNMCKFYSLRYYVHKFTEVIGAYQQL